MKITLHPSGKVKKRDWKSIEDLPVGQYEDDRKAPSGHIFKIHNATWLTQKSIVCVTAQQYKNEVEI